MKAGNDSTKRTGAPMPTWATDLAVRRVGITCRTATEGRRAVRALAEWAHRFDLGEAEFQVLWCLRSGPVGGVDQTTLAKRLACSPAQVSATVERMRLRGWITSQPNRSDRRRNLWELAEAGRQLLVEMLAAIGFLPSWESPDGADRAAEIHPPEAAA